MIVYHLLPSRWALDDLTRGRIKISRISDLNDPFELLATELPDRKSREVFYRWRRHISTRYGVMCFSRSWSHPMLWSHYGDKHRGIALGFRIDDEYAEPVRYVGKRLASRVHKGLPMVELTEDWMRTLLFTKFEAWKYEDEVRVAAKLIHAEDGLYFRAFDESVRLHRVVVGARSDVNRKEVEKVLRPYGPAIDLVKARLAFCTFKVVKNKQGFGAGR